MNYTLENEDIILLKDLISISKKIFKIYKNLYNLEIHNQLHTTEYKKT